MKTITQTIGQLPTGEKVKEIVLQNQSGMKASIITYGATLTSLLVPDRDGNVGEVCLGFPDLAPYLKEHPYFGAVVGRYANRIAGGRFSIGGKYYDLTVNSGPNTLHGGKYGFNSKNWQLLRTSSSQEGAYALLTAFSPDGEDGFPGNLQVWVSYFLDEHNDLYINYSAISDRATVINMTHHAYFNLNDGGKSQILDHELQIFADHITEVDENLIPTGVLTQVEGTPFDFRKAKPIGLDITRTDPQLMLGNGFDHNFVLRGDSGEFRKAAIAYSPSSGRKMEVWTTEPGMQLYTANYLDSTQTGHHGVSYGPRSAFCLETQHFPDSPNQPDFPSTLLPAGKTFHSRTAYIFMV